MAATAALIAALGGIFITVQTVIIGAFNRDLHPIVVAMWVHVGGLIFGFLLVLALRLPFNVDVVRAHPWGLLAGVFGMGIVATIGVAVGTLGVGTTLALVTGAQLLLAFSLDAVGVGGQRIAFDPLRILGAVAIVGGVLLVFGRSPTT